MLNLLERFIVSRVSEVPRLARFIINLKSVFPRLSCEYNSTVDGLVINTMLNRPLDIVCNLCG